jgi:hypothetical protein
MIESFFSNQSAFDEIKQLFSGLRIWKDKKAIEFAGKYPVVSLSFMGLIGSNWPDALIKVALMIREAFQVHLSRVKNRISDDFYDVVEAILNSNNIVDPRGILNYSSMLSETLKMLTRYLHEAYGERVILLIDEYDAPIIHAQNKGYCTEAVDFLKVFMGTALKDNNCLEFAIVTGVVQIARESIFSELNNLVVCDIFSGRFASHFGFTEVEVAELAKIYGKEHEMEAIRRWYNGYLFGKVEIYNPFSVMNYFYSGEFASYWVNTSENTLIQDLLKSSPSSVISEVLHLLAGGFLEKTIRTRIPLRNLHLGTENVFSLLVNAGYLKAASDRISGGGHVCSVTIPNEEMPDCFYGMFRNLLDAAQMGGHIEAIVKAMISAEEKEFENRLNDYLFEVISAFDSLEAFYHGFMVSLAGYAYEDYQIRSNREVGAGRYDLAMYPKNPLRLGALLEFKKLGDGEDLEALLEKGLGQVDELQYALEFKLKGIKYIVYTMVFKGKVCRLRLRK